MRKVMLILLVCFTGVLNAQNYDYKKYTSGDEELDALRAQITSVPTSRDNYDIRLLMMKLWAVSIQQQGFDLGPEYLDIDLRLRRISKWNPVFNGDAQQVYSDKDMEGFRGIIKDGYALLDKIQKAMVEDPESVSFQYESKQPEVIEEPQIENIDWGHYKADEERSGFSGADGPVHGRIAWEFPVGLRWESKPVVVGNEVLVTSPGMRNILFTFDLSTGKLLKKSTHIPIIRGDQLYSTPANASTPIVLEDHVLLREMGSRGNKGISKHIVFVNRKTGKVDKRIDAGHVDYRVGFPTLAANEKYLVYPFAIHDIEERPPISQPFNRIICKDIKTGKKLWDFNVGPIFGAPVLDDNRIFIGNKTGTLYCLKADQWYFRASAERIAWEFDADGAINKKVELVGDKIYFGTNSGTIYCLNKVDGSLVWKKKIENPEPNAFRQFSTPLVKNGKVFIGGANKQLLILDAATGDQLFVHTVKDWIKSRPIADESFIYVACINGEVSKINYARKKPKLVWTKKISDHHIYGNLEKAGNKILFTDADLYTYCFDTEGKILWKQSAINSFMKDDYRVLTDQIAGGAYYESKPTVSGGTVYIGTPSRFVYAIDSETGKEKWKFEVGGAISGAPVEINGKVYIGQEGGEDEFYCLNAENGNVIWTQNIGWVWGSVNVSEGRVYIPGVDGYVNCLDAEDGDIKWRYRTERSTCSEPLIIGDYVYFGSWDHYLYKFDKMTGEFIWKYQLSGGSDSGSPVGGDGKIFLPVGGAKFRCLDPKTKDVLWTPSLEGKMYNVTPAYHDKRVFLSSLNGQGIGGIPVGAEVFSVNSDNGEVKWTFNGGGGLTGPVIGNNNRVYFGSTVTPYFYCVDEKGNDDGATNLLWKVHMHNKVEESVPAIYNGKAYILNSGGYLVAIE